MRIPPFKGLYYFSVAAREQSLKKAASLLSVTQAAVSQQIRLLEESLGVKLFYRQHRLVVLTPEGERLLPYLQQAFHTIDMGMTEVFDDTNPNAITLSILPSFASRWLIPRLVRWYERYPDIAVNLSMTTDLEDFSSHSVDAAIRLGSGVYEGLATHRLMGDSIYPVCHPNYCERYPIASVDDLRPLRLLGDANMNLSWWEYWLSQNGYQDFELPSVQRYDGSHYVIDSALSGQGVAMVRHSLAAELVAQGNLVMVLGNPVPLKFSYYFSAPTHYMNRPKLQQFLQWLMEEAQQFEAQGLPS